MDELQKAALDLATIIRRLSIAESVKENLIEDIFMAGKILQEDGDKSEVQKLVAGLNGSLIAFLDYSLLMEPYARWKKAIAAILLK